MTKRERFSAVLGWFEEHVKEAESELNYNNPFELLVAVILSAQCTDKRVNLITPALFEAYPTVHDMAKADADDIFHYIRSVSYPNNKSKHLAGMARELVCRFAGEVPSQTEELETLPGVGRKTANVIAAVIFDQPKMAVDTHVFRVSERIGLTTNSKTPLQTELTLTKYIPVELIPKAHHWLILHGRYVCLARKPKCEVCGLTPFCWYFQKMNQKSKTKTVDKAS